MMSHLISDIASDRIEPRKANAICNAGGKLLKIVELEHKYGRRTEQVQPAVRELILAPKG